MLETILPRAVQTIKHSTPVLTVHTLLITLRSYEYKYVQNQFGGIFINTRHLRPISASVHVR